MKNQLSSGPSAIEARNKISEIIGECVYQALGLKESLRDERAALETQDMTALHAAVSTKGEFVQSLSQLENQRRQLCDAAGFAGDSEQMDHLTQWCDEDSVIQNGWSHLMEIVSDCNALNLTNGAIIRARQQMVEANLGVLRGTDAHPDTYQREGRENAAMNQRSLAQA
jgi:flagella synthesis protein FlgN